MALSLSWALLRQIARIARTIFARCMQLAVTAISKRSINFLASRPLFVLVECTLSLALLMSGWTTTILMKRSERKKARLLSTISAPTFVLPSSLWKRLKHMKLTMILTSFRNMKLNFL